LAEPDKCLNFLSFFSSNEGEIKNGFLEQVEATENDDIIYCFEKEHFIRIGCKKVELVCY